MKTGVDNFIKEILFEYEREARERLPYRINLLEEVHMHDDGQREELSGIKKKVCENAHTRILARILKFKNNNGYVILKSLLDYLGKQSKSVRWNEIHVEEPLIRTEYNCKSTTGRIDLLIKEEKKYAIVFENKINEAGDQAHQLARYIKQLSDEGFNSSQIFVLYLSAEGRLLDEDKNSFQQTWQLEDGTSYREAFKGRFFDLSFRYNILPWLTDIVRPLVSSFPEQIYLQSAVNQYVDYLEGRFGQRRSDDAILRNVISGKITGEDLNVKLQWIDSKTKVLSDIMDSLKRSSEEEVRSTIRVIKQITETFYSIKKDLLQEAIGNYPFDVYERPFVYERTCYFGFRIIINDNEYVAYIGKYSYFFFSLISYPNKDQAIDQSVIELFPESNHHAKNRSWYALSFEDGDYSGAVNILKRVLDRFCHLLIMKECDR